MDIFINNDTFQLALTCASKTHIQFHNHVTQHLSQQVLTTYLTYKHKLFMASKKLNKKNINSFKITWFKQDFFLRQKI